MGVCEERGGGERCVRAPGEKTRGEVALSPLSLSLSLSLLSHLVDLVVRLAALAEVGQLQEGAAPPGEGLVREGERGMASEWGARLRRRASARPPSLLSLSSLACVSFGFFSQSRSACSRACSKNMRLCEERRGVVSVRRRECGVAFSSPHRRRRPCVSPPLCDTLRRPPPAATPARPPMRLGPQGQLWPGRRPRGKEWRRGYRPGAPLSMHGACASSVPGLQRRVRTHPCPLTRPATT